MHMNLWTFAYSRCNFINWSWKELVSFFHHTWSLFRANSPSSSFCFCEFYSWVVLAWGSLESSFLISYQIVSHFATKFAHRILLLGRTEIWIVISWTRLLLLFFFLWLICWECAHRKIRTISACKCFRCIISGTRNAQSLKLVTSGATESKLRWLLLNPSWIPCIGSRSWFKWWLSATI